MNKIYRVEYMGHFAQFVRSARRIEMRSEFIRAKSDECTKEDELDVIAAMYKAWFQNAVDNHLGLTEQRLRVHARQRMYINS